MLKDSDVQVTEGSSSAEEENAFMRAKYEWVKADKQFLIVYEKFLGRNIFDDETVEEMIDGLGEYFEAMEA